MDAPTAQITRVTFSLLSPAEIRARSVVCVDEPSLYLRTLPRAGGLNDLRMGATDRRLRCATCKNSTHGTRPCVGHPGHMDLAEPVYHLGHVPRLAKILCCVCFFCSKALYGANAGAGKSRLSSAAATGRARQRHACPHCGGPQPIIRRVGMGLTADFADDVEWASPEERVWATQPLTAARVREILHFIPHAVLTELGFHPSRSHPENMVLTVLPVSPPIIRPSIMATDGSRMRGQDDLTVLMQGILKANQVVLKVRARAPSTDSTVRRAYLVELAVAIEELQRVVATFVHHDTRGTMVKGGAAGGHSNHRKLRGVNDRLKGKKGRIRGTLQGQRVNKSGRTVVGGSPTLDMDCVCVPEAMAMKLTVTVHVNDLNLKDMQARVRIGPKSVAGARSVTLLDGSQIDLDIYDPAMMGELELQTGCVVERFLQDDDWVVFNRQPSLHKMSMMAHRARLHKLNTFGLSICATTPYNADFDGDEVKCSCTCARIRCSAHARTSASFSSNCTALNDHTVCAMPAYFSVGCSRTRASSRTSSPVVYLNTCTALARPAYAAASAARPASPCSLPTFACKTTWRDMLCAYAAARCWACAAFLRAENDLRAISSRR